MRRDQITFVVILAIAAGIIAIGLIIGAIRDGETEDAASTTPAPPKDAVVVVFSTANTKQD
jgi:hypothetical protein